LDDAVSLQTRPQEHFYSNSRAGGGGGPKSGAGGERKLTNPRRIYETCLFGHRGDRKIVSSVANAYGAPTDRSQHMSAKPEPVLRHFFRMFVDENSTVLDPTCGSGTALRAAESLGAAHILGIEVNEEFAERAAFAVEDSRESRPHC